MSKGYVFIKEGLSEYSTQPPHPNSEGLRPSTHLEDILYQKLQDKDKEVETLRDICADSYQIVGDLAFKAGVFDTKQVEMALDNLLAVADGTNIPHNELLHFSAEQLKKNSKYAGYYSYIGIAIIGFLIWFIPYMVDKKFVDLVKFFPKG